MPPEEFFRGTTQAGRTLVLYYEHTAFDAFGDETGETFDNPSETKITGTLDGAPIDVQAVNWSRDTATVRSDDLGTFTATNTDYGEDHSEALRGYLEYRPSGGYEVAIVDKGQVGDEASYTVTITKRPPDRASGVPALAAGDAHARTRGRHADRRTGAPRDRAAGPAGQMGEDQEARREADDDHVDRAPELGRLRALRRVVPQAVRELPRRDLAGHRGLQESYRFRFRPMGGVYVPEALVAATDDEQEAGRDRCPSTTATHASRPPSLRSHGRQPYAARALVPEHFALVGSRKQTGGAVRLDYHGAAWRGFEQVSRV